jgi:hypothetical protein
MKAIDYGARHHYRSWAPPRFDFDAVREHFVQPSDWPILERAAAVSPRSPMHESYSVAIEVDGWDTEFRVSMPPRTEGKPHFLWPTEPTRLVPERHESELMEQVYQWAEHRAETAIRWALVEGMFNEFDRSAQPVSVLKELWPDFDMLLHAIPGYKLGRETREWLERFHNAPRPRRVDVPVPDCVDLLEDVRSTVLAMTLMPKELPAREEGSYKVWLSDYKKVQLPWYEWLRDEGRLSDGTISHRMDENPD